MEKKLNFKEKYLVFVKKNKANVNFQVLISIIITSVLIYIIMTN
jgi:hypothetical protein